MINNKLLTNFTYSIENDQIILEEYIGNDEIVEIPEQYKNKKVVLNNEKGGFGVFEDKKIEKVILPNTITEIPYRCFLGSTIEEIVIPDSVKIIEDLAFHNCKNLKKINLPESILEIKEGAFADSGLYKIKLPNKLKKINENTFASCPLKEIDLPNTIKKIKKGSFSSCYSLEKISLPNNLEYIEEYAFCNCSYLKSINIPRDIKKIAKSAFDYCDNLILDNLENKYIKIENNNIYQKEKTKSKETNYILTNCNQKNNTLTIKENETLKSLIGKNIKHIIIKNKKECDVLSPINLIHLNSLIIDDTNKIFLNIYGTVKNIYITNNTKEIKNISVNASIRNLYFNGTKEQIEDVQFIDSLKYKNLTYKKEFNELLDANYTLKQIDQILKGYEKNILLSNINKEISDSMLRDIVTNFSYQDPELYNILNILEQKEITLEDQIEIQNIIKDQTKENNTVINEIER